MVGRHHPGLVYRDGLATDKRALASANTNPSDLESKLPNRSHYCESKSVTNSFSKCSHLIKHNSQCQITVHPITHMSHSYGIQRDVM